jgi:xanthine dehydrogenase YagR molybdenum-binding subunit
MRDGDWLVGMGTATALYPSNIASAAARVTLFPDNTARVESATHEIGQGVTTACALIAAEKLGLDPARVAVALGDSSLPPAPVSGGSNSTASVGNAIAKACDEILIKRRRGLNDIIEAYADYSPKGASQTALKKLYGGKPAFASDEKTISYAFGAQFVEVRVHCLTGEIRVPRHWAHLPPAPSSIPRRRRANCLVGSSGASRRRCTRKPRSTGIAPAITMTI